MHFNVGAYGSRSDGGVWAEDNLGAALESGHLDSFIPPPKYLPGDVKVTSRDLFKTKWGQVVLDYVMGFRTIGLRFKISKISDVNFDF